jgi:hypothetical protein
MHAATDQHSLERKNVITFFRDSFFNRIVFLWNSLPAHGMYLDFFLQKQSVFSGMPEVAEGKGCNWLTRGHTP